MKNTLLLLLSAFALSLNAQVSCTPDPNNTNIGSSPAPEDIPCVERTVYYEQVVQVLLPTSYMGFDLESFEMNTVGNLPSGIDYVCHNTNCKFIGGQPGCFVAYGTTTDTAGRYDITFTGTAYVKTGIITIPYNIDESMAKQAGFNLYLSVVEKDSACPQYPVMAVDEITQNQSRIKAFYNQETHEIIVKNIIDNSGIITLEVFNMLGENIISKTYTQNSDNTYRLESPALQKGIYFIRVNNISTKVFVK